MSTRDKATATKTTCLCPERAFCPADVLGISKRCCLCVPLKPGAIIICLISFIWSGVELKQADRKVADIVPGGMDSIDHQIMFYMYFALCIGFVLATSGLLVGVLRNKYILVSIYLWYAFFFNIVSVSVTLVTALSVKLRHGSVPRGKVCKSVVAVIWACLICHFIIVINSFKYKHTLPVEP